MEMTCSDVTLCSWNSPAASAGNNGFYLAKHSGPKPSWLQNFRTDVGTCVQTPVHDTSDLKQCLIDTWASISQNVIDKAVGQSRKRLCASIKAKEHYFEPLLNLNRLFSDPARYATGSFLSLFRATNSPPRKTRISSFPPQLFKSR